MRLLLIGCEYAGTTTLAVEMSKWMERVVGGAIHGGLAFHDHQEMVRHPDIDVVSVVIRVPFHYEMTMAALNAGKHVFTEWPLGANLAEAEEMAELARTGAEYVSIAQLTQAVTPIEMTFELASDVAPQTGAQRR